MVRVDAKKLEIAEHKRGLKGTVVSRDSKYKDDNAWFTAVPLKAMNVYNFNYYQN